MSNSSRLSVNQYLLWTILGLLAVSSFVDNLGGQENSIGTPTKGVPGSLVGREDYQQALQMSAEQIEQFEDLSRAFGEQSNLIWDEFPGLPKRRSLELYQQREEERAAAFADLEREFFEKSMSILTKDQVTRHLQLQSWSHLVSKGRFAFFSHDDFAHALKLPPDTFQMVEQEAREVEKQFDVRTRRKLDELQDRILQQFTDAQRKELKTLNMPLDWSIWNNWANATLRQFYADWDRELSDDAFLGSFTYTMHSQNSNAQLLGLDRGLIEQLNELAMEVNRKQAEELQKIQQTEKVTPEHAAKIRRNVADDFLPVLKSLLGDKFDQHEILQFEFRARVLAPFRRYGDTWLLKRLKVSSSQEKDILRVIDECLSEFHTYLIDETHKGWKRIIARLDVESRLHFDETLGELPTLFIGHIGK